MRQYQGRPAQRERRADSVRTQNVSTETREGFSDRRLTGEPAKFNTRSELRRIVWENDLYERQSM